MATSPQTLEKNLEEEAKNYEKQIDHVLETKKIVKGSRLTMDVPKGMNHYHFQVLRPLYMEAGWREVSLKSYSRGGVSYLEFIY